MHQDKMAELSVMGYYKFIKEGRYSLDDEFRDKSG